jgi:DNA-binding response OmpR family regulator
LLGVNDDRLVLVVEDDQVTRSFLLDNLMADGFRAAGASGVGEGLRAIEVRQPALVVLDLGLEDGNGLALLDRVRAADGLASRIDPDLPVIVLSGRAGDADRVRSFARGPMTTSASRSCTPSCWRACARCCDARRGDAARASCAWES